uniref:Uncharacterized protein n=1 Tax=Gorilla gorilla gorilla TaxID=9595 RepID=A0A2I2ZUI4_GORGO
MPVAVMAESTFSFKKLLDQCENQELEAPGGIATPPVYGQRLALCLLHNDMNNFILNLLYIFIVLASKISVMVIVTVNTRPLISSVQ